MQSMAIWVGPTTGLSRRTTARDHIRLLQPLNNNLFLFSSHSGPIIHNNNAWTFSEQISSCFHDNLFKWASWIICIYMFALSSVADAHESVLSSSQYACEDVQSYYAGIHNLEGEALSRKLNSVISGHHSLSYKEVWNALKILDAAEVREPEGSSSIVEIYTGRVVRKSLAGKPEGWNREHLWPRSYGLIHRPSLTDLHNIRPADVNVNSSRGNKYFGECHVGSTHCRRPASKEAASDTETDSLIWAPPRRVRGDVARAVMYMAVRYGFHHRGEGPVLHLSDNPSMVKREMGLLSILLKWNELDPPSREESLRNERICRHYQHNRNPFVDHPEYANLIWKAALSSSPKSPYALNQITAAGFENEIPNTMREESTDSERLDGDTMSTAHNIRGRTHKLVVYYRSR